MKEEVKYKALEQRVKDLEAIIWSYLADIRDEAKSQSAHFYHLSKSAERQAETMHHANSQAQLNYMLVDEKLKLIKTGE